MENLLYGLEVMVVGITVVFAVLVGLMYSIKGLAYASEKMEAREKAKADVKS